MIWYFHFFNLFFLFGLWEYMFLYICLYIFIFIVLLVQIIVNKTDIFFIFKSALGLVRVQELFSPGAQGELSPRITFLWGRLHFFCLYLWICLSLLSFWPGCQRDVDFSPWTLQLSNPRHLSCLVFLLRSDKHSCSLRSTLPFSQNSFPLRRHNFIYFLWQLNTKRVCL